MSKKPYIKTIKEDNTTITYEICIANDSIGDLAFEYDFNDSQRQEWNKYIKKLEQEGKRGELVTFHLRIQKIPSLDGWDNLSKEQPFLSYSMLITDYNEDLC